MALDVVRLAAQKLFLPLSYRREGFDIIARTHELEETQYYPCERLRELRWRRLREILEVAHRSVPYYQALFKRIGLQPGDVKSDSDLAAIPVLTKQNIRDHQNELISTEYNRTDLIPKKTGGSTGVPLNLFWSRRATAAKKAATVRHDSWTGYRPGEKLAALWGVDPGMDKWRYRLYNYLTLRRLSLDTLDMSEKAIELFLYELRRRRVPYLFGHAHSLYILARYVQQHNIHDLPVRSILSTAEVLTDHERQTIETIFGAPVFDRYGCEELSVIASECEVHEGMHLNAEGLWVEIKGAAGETPGELIITDLTNDAMPFIRYRTEDMALPLTGACPCGRTLPRLKKIYGRQSDFLYTPEGRMLSGISAMDHMAIEIPGIWQVQVVQERLDFLRFRIVRTEKFGDHSLAIMRELVPKFFGPQMTYDVQYVDALERTPRGKYQFSICKIDPPRSGG